MRPLRRLFVYMWRPGLAVQEVEVGREFRICRVLLGGDRSVGCGIEWASIPIPKVIRNERDGDGLSEFGLRRIIRDELLISEMCFLCLG